MKTTARSRYVTLRGPLYSYLVHKKAVTVTLLLLAVTTVLMIVSTGIGSVYIAPGEVVRSIFGFGSDSSEMIVRSLRLPRVIMAVLIGAALAVSGAILQGIVRNSLASPDTVGTTGGATLGAVLFFFFLSNKLSIHLLPLAAVIGAFAATLLVYILSWKNGVMPLRLVLVGIGFSAAMSSLSYMLMISGPIVLANQSLTFMTGSVYGVSWEKSVLPLLPWMIVLLPLIFLCARHLNIQGLGEDIAKGVAFGGAINFIGLLAPHIGRKLVGPSFGALLPVSALCGAIILLLADLAGRTLLPPHDIPAGVFTAAIGAPFFIYLLYRSRHR
ncbi:iron ABC transporter permease [Paenibacillus filicis]|uniref:Iron ABC transporter permease n=1 Tax=Paenibacillus gyeongsangnamensis TaxID=3388067 RepID=A0ABT4QFF0_9BACL|nr:iron ABC transporter permease [Paenibacillus filicis]MCZ8515604.1 iron ABC transporter permease [Paenibacillus filicis]